MPSTDSVFRAALRTDYRPASRRAPFPIPGSGRERVAKVEPRGQEARAPVRLAVFTLEITLPRFRQNAARLFKTGLFRPRSRRAETVELDDRNIAKALAVAVGRRRIRTPGYPD